MKVPIIVENKLDDTHHRILAAFVPANEEDNMTKEYKKTEKQKKI